MTHIYNTTGTYQVIVTAANGTNTLTDALEVQVVRPVLAIGKGASSAQVDTDQLLTYTLVVTNTGDAPATNLLIVDAIPQGVQVAQILNGGQQQGQEVRWTVAALSPGASVSVQFVVRAGSTAGTIVNDTYSVTADTNAGATGSAVTVLVVAPPEGTRVYLPRVVR
ncbi:MAG: DUF11 domain-containing protein [Chloroflexaceae bacterium]|nr:DUF11 domain-containing protein [Chloroflexaceae bacterium]NJO05036.1 DUF11 domain-containing protein [Chloroflexaceae bacterium]